MKNKQPNNQKRKYEEEEEEIYREELRVYITRTRHQHSQSKEGTTTRKVTK